MKPYEGIQVPLETEDQFWERFEAEATAIRADPEAWAEELAERAIWDTALNDGLDDETMPNEKITRRSPL